MGVIHRRKWLTLEKKLDIIRSHESGKTYARIARENGMNESSIRSILRRKDEYKEQAASTTSLMSKVVTRQRSSPLNTMEQLLISWIEDCNRKRIQLTENAIQSKALTLYNELKEHEDGDVKMRFTASRGWFYRFKNRVNLQNCIISKEKPAWDKEAAGRFPVEFEEIVREGEYTRQQIFNVDEIVLFWKKMPSKTYLGESEKFQQGYKPSRDGLTLLAGANASGDLRLKPLVVFRAETPSALKDCEKSSLPVIWRSNKKAWLTNDIFQDWFDNHFCPLSEAYCEAQGIPFKILLLLDSSPSHDISFSNENVKVVFLPANTAAILQPMSQGPFSLLKACYLRQILSQAVQASSGPVSTSLMEFWKNYNIKNGVHNISASWNEITGSDLTSIWHRLLPNVKYTDFDMRMEDIIRDVVTMGKYFGLDSLDASNVQNCIDSTLADSEETNLDPVSEPIVFKEEVMEEDEYLETQEEEETKKMDIDVLEKILESVDVACETILSADANVERSIKVRQVLQNGIQCYRDLCLELKKKRRYF